ncbi:MAG: hypothetical protein RJB66_410 [Pseudomonadota bacterium]|jgi:murein DD-endopeptidase MepM/ murein hydrolase activator NlpD
MKKKFLLGLLIAFVGIVTFKSQAPQEMSPLIDSENIDANSEFPYSVKKNATLSTELMSHGFTGQDVQQILKLSKPHFNLAKLPQGLRYRLMYSPSPILSWGSIEFQLSKTKSLLFTSVEKNVWSVKLNEKKVEVRLVHFMGNVRSSLWESARLAKMSPALIAQLTDIFSWDLDFSRQVTEADSWRLTVEQLTSNGRVIGWGRIIAADYNNNGKSYHAFYYDKPGRLSGYFDLQGRSLARSFLRAPIEFARISSGFSLRRFHPKLKIFRPHLGVDYAAPRGTPVRALGDGVIAQANYSASGGNTVALVHNNGTFKTRYLHLNGFAPRIRTGSHVKQGQVIGYVGSTGLSTGPHLHFEFYKNNRYVDPLRVELPASESIPSDLLAEFEVQSALRLNDLPPFPRTVASN